MDRVINQIEHWFLSARVFIIIYVILLISSGLLYLFSQFQINQEIADSVFLGLLFGGSLILLVGIKWIQLFFQNKIENFYDCLVSREELPVEVLFSLSRKIFKNPLTIIAGILYGIAVGAAPYLFDLWSNQDILKIELSVFLFVVNFLTGSALYSLVMLFQFLYKTSKHVPVDLYDRYNDSARFITDLSKRASIIASLYVAFSITSIYFSEFPLNVITIAYSIFAGVIILTAYVVPMIPIRNKIVQLKRKTINTLSIQIQKELDSFLDNTEVNYELDASKYETLVEVRDKVASLPSFPIGIKAIWNGLSIIGITLLPVLIEFLLEKV